MIAIKKPPLKAAKKYADKYYSPAFTKPSLASKLKVA